MVLLSRWLSVVVFLLVLWVILCISVVWFGWVCVCRGEMIGVVSRFNVMIRWEMGVV